MKYIFMIISAFAFGWYVNGLRLELEFKEFKLNAEKQYSKLLEDKELNEKVLRDEMERLEQEKQSAISDINDNYNDLLTKYNSLYSDNRNSNHKDSMSNTSNTSTRSSKACNCKSSKKNGQSFKEALEIARDCDLLAEKYNRLLIVYDTIRKRK